MAGNKSAPDFYDQYSQAIPWDELVELAKADMDACKEIHSKESLRECAEKLVLSKVCSCATESAPIVEALVDEYLRQLGTGKSGS
ncbi:hypothetical protein NITGR_590050 [Nitrospina gracilis 3/211]|uniref:Uncharacterized protein n=1 Tax=Nitrospina gracilis (strain 3/211) TaxID=1266370 RepID=M1Z100_NITG3|nr:MULTISPECIES: hypothetical protein [Nitrospina]MCF8724044.1 hypothetical protein [Nitrospina sp. Nb-3]CCQ91174.1 hypothetical protein NITGR_590050 [Nitrospina gracilis 3/211]